MRLYTFGDSHCMFGWKQLKESGYSKADIVINHLGPKLMHTFGNKGLEILDLRKYPIKSGDSVVFSFGEIDCRCHISKFHKKYEAVIEEAVLRYMEAVEENIKNIAPVVVTVCIQGIVPTVEKSKSEQFNNKDFPFLGEDDDRKKYILLMNELLSRECELRGFVFIDMFSNFSDRKGFLLPPPHSDGTVHANDFSALIPFIDEYVVGKPTTICSGTLIYGERFNIPEVYQAVFGKESEYPQGRLSESRIRTILNADRVFNNSKILNSSICDFGSNLGHVSMSLEKAGCSGLITGVENGTEFLNASKHIANSVGSKCEFRGDILPAQVYLLLSVTHHWMKDNTFSGVQWLFDYMVSSGAHTIYVEQATHLEHPKWAEKLLTQGNIYMHFVRELDKATRGQFNVRLVGCDRNKKLNTVRPIYQLKRKINKEITVSNPDLKVPEERFIAYDEWNIPFIGASESKAKAVYYYAKNSKGEDFFIKNNTVAWFKPQPKIEGFLLSDILRLGLLPFYDVEKLRTALTRKYEESRTLLDDYRPWNVIVTEDSDAHLIDSGEWGYTEHFFHNNDTSQKIISVLLR